MVRSLILMIMALEELSPLHWTHQGSFTVFKFLMLIMEPKLLEPSLSQELVLLISKCPSSRLETMERLTSLPLIQTVMIIRQSVLKLSLASLSTCQDQDRSLQSSFARGITQTVMSMVKLSVISTETEAKTMENSMSGMLKSRSNTLVTTNGTLLSTLRPMLVETGVQPTCHQQSTAHKSLTQMMMSGKDSLHLSPVMMMSSRQHLSLSLRVKPQPLPRLV